ncbi:DnaJ family domain-containing protein [Streptomyces chattanoogensis]|uniref:DnaJ family domain-containing protein n=1 Tax=Streptomyces chattanoogensis TaxID=66876 RepID=UPI0036AC70B2
MTERKPPGVDFESWVDKQIREATERGDFAHLAGKGKPLRDLDQPYDELWWIKDKIRRENVSCLPPSLVLRKEAEDALEAASHAPTEAALRRILTDINERIRAALCRPPEGPPLHLTPFDIDEEARKWRARHGS